VTTSRAPRVAIVGARRVRTGLGPFLAKHLVAAGAEVPAFVASSEETIEAGRAALRAVGVDARGYADIDRLTSAYPIDALVVASPHESHRRWIEAALERKLHVLCEKPFVWGDPVPANEAMRLVELAADRNLVVFENCPWPYALPAFDALHPTARRDGVRSFEMEMAPSSTGAAMLVDALSHPLSVLQELVPDGEAAIRALAWPTIEERRIEMSFEFGVPKVMAKPIQCAVRLRTVPAQPRPMALVVNGFRTERQVRTDDYSFSLASEGREVPLPDPMAALVGEFVRAVRSGEPAEAAGRRTWRIYERLRLLHQIVRHFPGP
jgi:predicted dehydrogenase